MFDPVTEVRKQYPALQSTSDEYILKELSDPGKFRAAFPQYKDLGDDWIIHNMKVYRGAPPVPKPPTFKEMAIGGTSLLPAAGATAGALLAAPTVPATGPAGPIAGAALGGAAGEAAKQMVQRFAFKKGYPETSKEAAGRIGEQAAQQGALEAGGQIASRALKGAGKLIFQGEKDLKLPSGAIITTTPGMRNPDSIVGFFEKGAQGLPFGKRLRESYATAEKQVRQELVNIAARNPGGGVTAAAPDAAFNQASIAAKEVAAPYHRLVEAEMSSPEAAEPVADAIAAAAKKELDNVQVQNLLSRSDVSPSVKGNLEKLAGTNLASPEGVPIPPAPTGSIPLTDPRMVYQLSRDESMRDVAKKAGYKSVAELLSNPASEQWVNQVAGDSIAAARQRLAPVPPPPRTASVAPGEAFKAFRDTRSSLLDLAQRPSMTRNEKRILYGMVNRVDAALTEAIRATGGEELEAAWREGNRLTAQSYGLEKLRDALRDAVSPAGTALPGSVPFTEKIKGKKLVDALEDLSIADKPGASTELQRALTPSDQKTIKSLADTLRRTQAQGGTTLAAKFRVLAGIEVVGSLLTGHPGFAVAGAVVPEVSGWLFAKALTSRPGRNALLRFLSSPAGTAGEARLAQVVYQYGNNAEQLQNLEKITKAEIFKPKEDAQ